MSRRVDLMSREFKAPRGKELNCKNGRTEAIFRMLHNNLENAERPDDLIVYGGTGKAARNWECFDAIKKTLQNLESDETMLIQSGKPVGVFKTFENSPRLFLIYTPPLFKEKWHSFFLTLITNIKCPFFFHRSCFWS